MSGALWLTGMELALPYLSRPDVYRTLLIGALVVVVLALALMHAAIHGGPSWLAGQELALFLKLSLATAALVGLELCWKAKVK